jgi:hypothetical protein
MTSITSARLLPGLLFAALYAGEARAGAADGASNGGVKTGGSLIRTPLGPFLERHRKGGKQT